MRHFQKLRLDFIDRALHGWGKINRSDLMLEFSISESQASLDFRAFMVSYPDTMKYDKARKCYFPASMPYVRIASREKENTNE